MEAIFAVKSSPVPVVVSDIKSFTKAKEDSTRVGGEVDKCCIRWEGGISLEF